MTDTTEARRLADYLEEEWVTGDHLNAAAMMRQLAALVDAPRGTNAQILKEREITSCAITGAFAFGQRGDPAPEAGHWLEPFYQLGRQFAVLTAERDALRGQRMVMVDLLRDAIGVIRTVEPTDGGLVEAEMLDALIARSEQVITSVLKGLVSGGGA